MGIFLLRLQVMKISTILQKDPIKGVLRRMWESFTNSYKQGKVNFRLRNQHLSLTR